jgi:hypothetical protein
MFGNQYLKNLKLHCKKGKTGKVEQVNEFTVYAFLGQVVDVCVQV